MRALDDNTDGLIDAAFAVEGGRLANELDELAGGLLEVWRKVGDVQLP